MSVATLQAVSILVLILITLVGIIWAVVRERHMVDMHNKQTFAINDIGRTIIDATGAIRDGFENVHAKIEHSEDLTGEKRQEIIRLILDSERRCMDTMRDLVRSLQSQGIHTGTNVNIHGGKIDQAQIGDRT